MTEEPVTITHDSTPHASPALGSEADHAGAFLSRPKTPLTAEQLADRIIAKGLSVNSRKKLISALEVNGYYRFCGFWITLEQDGKYAKSITLDDILEIERLNRELSIFLFSGIAPVEIYLRAQLSYILAQHYGPRALHIEEAFKDYSAFRTLQSSLERETRQAARSKKSPVLSNLNECRDFLIWVEVENASFGTLSKIYGNLSDAQISAKIAERFEVPRSYLKSWLSYMTQIRNMCAHHDRIYNRNFCILPKMFKEHQSVDRSRLFAAFIVMFRLLEPIDRERADLARQQLGHIIDSHPKVDLSPAGFPANWRRVLKIPDPAKNDAPRPRGHNGGRPFKDTEIVKRALYLYDLREGTVAEIAKQCGISLSTLYKYIHQRNETKHVEYSIVSLEPSET